MITCITRYIQVLKIMCKETEDYKNYSSVISDLIIQFDSSREMQLQLPRAILNPCQFLILFKYVCIYIISYKCLIMNIFFIILKIVSDIQAYFVIFLVFIFLVINILFLICDYVILGFDFFSSKNCKSCLKFYSLFYLTFSVLTKIF